jgi:hypothetical protein
MFLGNETHYAKVLRRLDAGFSPLKLGFSFRCHNVRYLVVEVTL